MLRKIGKDLWDCSGDEKEEDRTRMWMILAAFQVKVIEKTKRGISASSSSEEEDEEEKEDEEESEEEDE